MVFLAQTVRIIPVIDRPEFLFRIVRTSIEPFLSVQNVYSAFNITVELDKLLDVSWPWSPDANGISDSCVLDPAGWCRTIQPWTLEPSGCWTV